MAAAAGRAYRLALAAEEARKVVFARLVPLGQRILASLTPPPPYTPHPVAVGPCGRPTAEERTALRRAIAATTPGARPASLMLGFGCKDSSGIVVDVAYERAARGSHVEGVWRVVHAEAATAGAHVTTLAELVRLLADSPDDYDQGVDQSKVSTLALIDPRPATLLALLGDARCTAADQVKASCVAGERAYYAASWDYLDVPSPARDALFYLAGGVLTRVASAADPRRRSQTLEIKLYRHGSALVALLLWPDEIVTSGGAGYDDVRPPRLRHRWRAHRPAAPRAHRLVPIRPDRVREQGRSRRR